MRYVPYLLACVASGFVWGFVMHMWATAGGGGWAGGNPSGHVLLAAVTGLIVGLVQLRYAQKHCNNIAKTLMMSPFSIALGSFLFAVGSMLIFAQGDLYRSLGFGLVAIMMSFIMFWWTIPMAMLTNWLVSFTLRSDA